MDYIKSKLSDDISFQGKPQQKHKMLSDIEP